jgi:hypothetical protein
MYANNIAMLKKQMVLGPSMNDIMAQTNQKISEMQAKMARVSNPSDKKQIQDAIDQTIREADAKIKSLRQTNEIQMKIDELTRESNELVKMLMSVIKSSEAYLIKDTFTPTSSQDVDTEKVLSELKSNPATSSTAASIEKIVKKMHADYQKFTENEKKLTIRSNILKKDMDTIAHDLSNGEADKHIIAHMFDLMNQSINVQCDHAVYMHNLKKQVMKIVDDLRKEGQKLENGEHKEMLTKLYDKMDEEKRVMCETKIAQAFYQDTIAEEMNELQKIKENNELTEEQHVTIQKLIDMMHQSKMMYPKEVKEGFEMVSNKGMWIVIFLLVAGVVAWGLLRRGRS